MSKTNNKKAVSILEEMSKDSGGGFEEVTSSDVQIPFIRVIQAMSPQIKKSDSAFIKGAGQGDIFNTVTKQFWSAEEGILVIPIHFQMKFLEFVPRDQGGGFVGELNPASEEVKKAKKIDKNSSIELLENDNEKNTIKKIKTVDEHNDDAKTQWENITLFFTSIQIKNC